MGMHFDHDLSNNHTHSWASIGCNNAIRLRQQIPELAYEIWMFERSFALQTQTTPIKPAMGQGAPIQDQATQSCTV